MSNFKEMKFRVRDEEHSNAIQKALFELGYEWFFGAELLGFTPDFIYTYADGIIRQDKFSNDDDECSAKDHYTNHKNTETTLAELHEMLETKQKIQEENCPPTSESQFTDNSISSDQLQKLIAEAQVSVLIEEDAIKIWADNDVEIVAKDEADLLAKLKVFRAYSEMVNGG